MAGMGECACENPESHEIESFGLAFDSPHLHLPKGDTMIYAIAVGTLCATVAIVWRISKPRRYVIARYEIESWERRQR